MDADAFLAFRLLLVLAAANTAPLAAKRLMKGRWAAPIDGGRMFVDGRPLLGASKTWRGLLAAVVASTVAASVLALHPALGATLGAAAMTGDALASFIKRRLRLAPSSRAFGLDQVPEALLPLIVVRPWTGLPWSAVFVTALAFLVLEPPLAKLWHRLGWRDQPY